MQRLIAIFKLKLTSSGINFEPISNSIGYTSIVHFEIHCAEPSKSNYKGLTR